MRKTTSIATLLFIFILHSGYCFAANSDSRINILKSHMSVSDAVPVPASEYLFDNGIDISLLNPIVLKAGEKKLFLFKPVAETLDKFIVMLCEPDSNGILMLLDSNSTLNEGSIIAFNEAENLYYTMQLSSECVVQLSQTMQSLISTLYSCGVAANPLGCVLDIIDLITNIYLTTIECGSEEAAAL